eukprot:TRINITY_DN43954_c0_g1_i1.p1 TRINITY_DN43954_c0_g1~~TRINITY_DN43954_c0_g1_i1.p1  ORF type:complete len:1041 (-),score=230.83 TRINITY_DN43954_c0_g1_i1:4188-7310(-)
MRQAFFLAVLLGLSRAVSSPSRYHIAKFDLNSADPTTTALSAESLFYAASASWSRTGVSSSVFSKTFSAVDFSTSSAPTSEYFEITVSGITEPSDGFADLHAVFDVIAGPDAPDALLAFSSLDMYAIAHSTASLTRGSTSNPAAVTRVDLRIPVTPRTRKSWQTNGTTGGSFPSSVTMRIAASSARATGLSSYVLLRNTVGNDTGIFAAPSGCPSTTCLQNEMSYNAYVPSENYVESSGLRVHRGMGQWDCSTNGTSVPGDGPFTEEERRSVTVSCRCECWSPAPVLTTPVGQVDGCDPATMDDFGLKCTSPTTVASAADITALDACDVLDGSLSITWGASVTLSRLRRITGALTMTSGATTTELVMPKLEYVGSASVQGTSLTKLEAPVLMAVCGGELHVSDTGIDKLMLPWLAYTPTATSMAYLIIEDNTALTYASVGSLGGGPLELVGNPSWWDPTLSLSAHSSQRLRVDGLWNLQTIRGWDGRTNFVTLHRLGGPGATLPSGVLSATYGWDDGSTDESMRLEITDNDCTTLVAEMPGVRGLTQLDVTGNSQLKELKLPSLGSGLALEMQGITIRDNPDLAWVDLGSVGGGPTVMYGLPGEGWDTLVLQGVSSQLLRVDGLSALTTIKAEPTKETHVRTEYLGGAGATFPSTLLSAAYGQGTERVRISFKNNQMTHHNEARFDGIVDFGYFEFEGNQGPTRLVVANAGSGTDFTCDLISVQDNPDLEHIDIGSVGGGPVVIRGATLYAGAGYTALALQGSATQRATVVGFSKLQAVKSNAGDANTVGFSFLQGDASTFPLQLLNAEYGTGAEMVDLSVSDCLLSPAGTWTFPNVTALAALSVHDNTGLLGLEFPRLGEAGGLSMLRIAVEANYDLTSVDLGSSGGGPVSVTGQQWGLLAIGGRSSARMTVTGLTSLTSISSRANEEQYVTFEHVTPSLPASVFNAAYGTGVNRVFLQVAYCDGNDFDFANVAELASLEILDNFDLARLKFPLLTAVTNDVNITDNSLLPDGCTSDIAATVGGTITYTNNAGPGACPA